MAKIKSNVDVPTQINSAAISFDINAFDAAIQDQGVKLVHYQALRCPVGMTDLDDNRRPHADHSGCSNGFIYKKAGHITALMTGNTNDMNFRDVGFVEGASATSSFPRFYDDSNKPFFMAPFDRFYLNEESIVVPTWELTVGHEAGCERFSFPVVNVEWLIDSRGEEYIQGVDFCINKNAQVEWLPSGKRPIDDLETDKGPVLSVRYHYRPYWYCARMLHEIRVTQATDPWTGERAIQRMPQQAILNREFLFQNQTKDNEVRAPRSSDPGQIGPSSQRQVTGPESGGFGPR